MVFDATSSAFPRPTTFDTQFALNPPVLPAPKPSAAQSAPDASNRSAKRRRTHQTDMSGSLMTPIPRPSSVSPAIDFDALDAARRRSSARVMSLWESLAARYARPLDEDDEIDILTGKIYKDRGVLRAASERGWKIGSFGEAIEVEPIIGASETETETGTSECDDEGEEEDATGDGVDAGEEEDSFETLSYDFQYRKLPPPRPELSPQDAEDLEEFLAAERAIQEEGALKNGNKQESEADEDEDEVVYLGDSLHNQDGTLRNDDSDDEEFSSFAIDESTLQLAKQEEDEDDDVGAMSSILGALAETSSVPSARDAHPGTSPSVCVKSGLEAGVEDELIVIESDTDEEADTDVESPLKLRPALDVSALSLVASSPSKGSFSSRAPAKTSDAGGQPRSSASGVRPAPSVSVSSSKRVQHNRTSFSAVVASLQASIITDGSKAEVSTPARFLSSTSSPSKSTAKPISKHVHPRTGAKTKDTKIVPAARTSAPSSLPDSLNGSKTHAGTIMATSTISPSISSTVPSNPPGRVSPGLPAKVSARVNPASPGKSATKRLPNHANEPRKTLAVTTTGSKPALIQATGGRADGTDPKPTSVPVGGPLSPSIPVRDKTPKPTQLVSPPITSSSRPARPESPIRSCKKPLVMEVVLTPPRCTSKSIPQPARSPTSTTPRGPLHGDSLVSHSGRSPEPAPNSEAKPTKTSNAGEAKDDQTSNGVSIIGTGVRANHVRKRPRESGEGLKVEDGTPKPQRQVGTIPTEHSRTVDSACSCCPPVTFGLGQNQPFACCSMPSGYFPLPPQPLHGCPHSRPQESCSHSHQLHQCSTVHHQHQHQHLHTHLPFPLPQHVHQFTAKDLTEAALQLVYGLGAMRPSGSSGYEMWLPPAAHMSRTLPHEGVVQALAQAGPSAQVSPPKLEPPSSQEEIIPDSQEKVLSSQEHERWEERGKQKGKIKPQLVQAKPDDESPPLPPSNLGPPPPPVPGRSNTSPSSPVDPVSPTPPSCPSPQNPMMPTPKRESSVIDIESDSEDELADFNAGEGSMRWEPPIKDEDDSDNNGLDLDDSEDDIMLLGKLGEGKSRRRLRPRRARGKQHFERQTSPSKLRKKP
ncbi:hypothetical protein FRC08_000018 [Ceratobasidium sp. 394]|nr:hypothetical protein FRC08_000018 [Ceratobasidium sp. 394]